jgi:hypothetical protein
MQPSTTRTMFRNYLLSFCPFDKSFCESKPVPGGNIPGWDPEPDSLVCLPNSDATTEGTCVACRHLQTAIPAGGSVKDEASKRDLNATCDPISSRGPNPAPQRKANDDVRWFSYDRTCLCFCVYFLKFPTYMISTY